MNDSQRIVTALDLAVLQPMASSDDIREAAKIVEDLGFATLCVASGNVRLARHYTPRVCSVIGFPHGNTLTEIKRIEANRAIDAGACELDVVVNFGRFLEGNTGLFKADLCSIIFDAHSCGVKVKAILETCYYTQEQIRLACEHCVMAGVDWVKTSTGFGVGGATPEAVVTMIETVAGRVQVKASGGIKTREAALQYLDLGCTRLGVSSYKGLL